MKRLIVWVGLVLFSYSTRAAFLRAKPKSALTPEEAKPPDNLAEELTDQVDSKGSSFAAVDKDKSGGVGLNEWFNYVQDTPEYANTNEFYTDTVNCFNLHQCVNGSLGISSVCKPSWVPAGHTLDDGLPPAQFSAATASSVHDCGALADEAEWKYQLDPDGNGKVEPETFYNDSRPLSGGSQGRDVFSCAWKNQPAKKEYVQIPHGCDAYLNCSDRNKDGVFSFTEVKLAAQMPLRCSYAETEEDIKFCTDDTVWQCFKGLQAVKDAQYYFEQDDSNKDGVVTMSEAQEEALRRCEKSNAEWGSRMDCRLNVKNAKGTFECVDKDHDGKASQEDWVVFVKARSDVKLNNGRGDTCEYFKHAFSRSDANDDGKLDWKELEWPGSLSCGVEYDAETMELKRTEKTKACHMRALRCLDKDADGDVSKDEYFSNVDVLISRENHEAADTPTYGTVQAAGIGETQMCLRRASNYAHALEKAISCDLDENGSLSQKEMMTDGCCVSSISEAGYVQQCAGVGAGSDVPNMVYADADAPSKANPSQTMAACVASKHAAGGSARPNKDAFKAMDANGDGKISQQEIYDSANRLPAGIGSEVVDKLIKSADADGDKFVSREEFEKAGARHKGDGPKAML